jgi:hypothetical protein
METDPLAPVVACRCQVKTGSGAGNTLPTIPIRMRLLCGLLTVCIAGAPHSLFGQEGPTSPTATVVPGADYEAGGLFRSLFGEGYRDLWTTAINVPILNLSTLGGGAVPVRIGGGMTTKTLHLDGADGRRYVLRSVNKSPVEFEDYAGGALGDLIQDQVSSFHPTGAPIVAHLLEAVDVLHPEPSFALVPDDPALGEFRDAFAGLLVLVEERPDDGPDGSAGFAGSRQIVQTDDLFDALEDDSRHHVDAEEFLRARLVDILVGDRDRSHNNHLWASFPASNGETVWRAVPRDRDQAFVRFDGFLKALARRYQRRLVAFGDAYPNLFALTRNTWDLDRTLLVGIDRLRWEQVTREVQLTLSDDVISEAVRRMPSEHVAVIGEDMTAALMSRRDYLGEASEALYRIVFSKPDIQGTDDAEELRVTRDADGSVAVSLQPLADGRTPTFQRSFSPQETSEIRIYMHGGDDRIVLEGGGAQDVLIHIMGGGGADTFMDDTSGPQSGTVLHDGGQGTVFPATGTIEVRRSSPSRVFSWFELDRDLDWGTLAIPQLTGGFDEDRGLVLVPGIRQDRFGFSKLPFAQRMELQVGWSFGLNEPLIDYRHLVRDIVGGSDLRFRFRWSGMEIVNFYGLGNETTSSQPHAFHRVTHSQVQSTLAASFGDGESRHFEIGPTITRTSTDTTGTSSYIDVTDPYGSGSFTHAGLRASLEVDARDYTGLPTAGYRIEGGASHFPGIFDVQDGAFGEAHLEVASYLSPPGGNPVLAVRASGKKVWGRYPFTEAAFLGGSRSVRSVRAQRFAGDAMALGSAELRLKLGRIVFPAPSDVGLFALADVGRVFLDGELPSGWHRAAGGGVWMALLGDLQLIQLSIARGEGVTRIIAGMGFAF